MPFNSLQYALFLPAVVLAHWALPRRWRTPLLLVASYVFYGSWAWRFTVLLALVTTVDWAVARAIGASDDDRRRRRLLLVSVVVDLGVLAYFKYAGFFVAEVTGVLDRLGWVADPVLVEVLLPIGISFFTFQSLSYVVDVHRRQLEPCASWVDYATFVAFFPQLVAGPISRANSLLPQLRAERRPPDGTQVASGLALILRGLVKKVVVADTLSGLVAPAFDDPSGVGALGALVGILAFAGQIYADFSAYTDIARGSARLFSIELVHNFRQPYLSRSVTELWRRWHISLSTWLRDYVYVPLGGNRGTARRTQVNLLATMVLGGLWHGAAWTFVLWGALHGAALAVERAVGRRVRDDDGLPTLAQLPAVLGTFAFTCVAWVLFRADSVGDALDVLAGLTRFGVGGTSAADVALLGVLLGVLLADDVVARTVRRPLDWAVRHPAGTGAGVGLAVAAVVVFSGGSPTPFIYFQF